MALIHFTSHLKSLVPCQSVDVESGALRTVLDAALAQNEPVRSYILDDQNRLRRHIMIFIDGQIIVDRNGLTDHVGPESEVYVMQALSGG